MAGMTIPKKWSIASPDPQLQVYLSNSLNIHPVLAQLLINRNVRRPEEAEAFLNLDTAHLHDPFLLKDMDKAVARIQQAARNGESVLIFGDYDVDGVTSSALLHNTLKMIGIKALNHIPHRVHDGYGLNFKIGEFSKQENVRLVITVDCGVNAGKEVRMFNEIGIDVIIIDHHEPPKNDLPPAVAVINPKRKDCPYPFKSLASVGLVAKLTQAILGHLPEDFLDLVALGTIADVAELKGENRTLVKLGLPRINKTKNLGLLALLEVAKIKDKKLSPYHVGFILGPRINATGRMDSAHKSLDLFLSDDWDQAFELAKTLDGFNLQRQKLQKEIIEQAIALIEQEVNFSEEKIIVIGKEGWHKGILGIAASRITETYYRPSVVISLKEGIGTASARSIEGFHLFEALEHCCGILEDYGGHKGAAGLTIKEENIQQFRSRINDFAKNTIEITNLSPNLNIDMEIPISLLSGELVKSIDSLEPFGEGNPSPVFSSRQLTVKSPPMILGKETLKFWITDGKVTLSAVGFGMAKYRDLIVPGKLVDLAYQPSIDEWSTRFAQRTEDMQVEKAVVQLKLKDIKDSNPAC